MRSFSVRLNLINLASFGLSLLLMGILTSTILFRQEKANLESRAQIAALELGTKAEQLIGLGLSLEDFLGFDEQCDEIIGEQFYFSGAVLYDEYGYLHSRSSRVSGHFLYGEDVLSYEKRAVFFDDGVWGAIYPVHRMGGGIAGYTVIYLDGDYYSARIWELLLFLLLPLLLISLLSLVVHYFVMKKMVGTPLAELIKIADNIDPRDMSYIEILNEKTRDDDIGRIYLAFYNLMVRLKDVNSELREQNRSLDEAVRKRTEELEEVNKQLEEDIIRRKELEEELRHNASTDKLTGLPNRASLVDWTRQIIGESQRHAWKTAFLFIDLDDFKKVNDTLGHEYGDRVLIEVGERLRRSLREADVIVRLGGDEFFSILPDVMKARNAGLVADKVIKSLSRPMLINGKVINVGASVGISFFPDDGDKGDMLISCADIAMYKAKSNGKNSYEFFDKTQLEQVKARMTLEESLRLAVVRKEFVPYYQPIINASDGSLAGFEALVRWKQEDGTIQPPGAFLDVADETGLINEIGLSLLEEACRRMVEWGDRAPGRMSVNLSPRQLSLPTIREDIEGILEETGMDPSRLELEITETGILERSDSIQELLGYFRAKGIKIAIDDFGTGYSSLAQLQYLPVDHLKIDRAFLKNLDDHKGKEIVASIISLGQTLNLQIVCEGVETDDHVAFLKKLNCGELQGYFFSRPKPAEELDKWLAESPE